MITITEQEGCGLCFAPLTRDGKKVICPNCGVRGTTEGEYETKVKAVNYSQRLHKRGHDRGDHRGKIA